MPTKEEKERQQQELLLNNNFVYLGNGPEATGSPPGWGWRMAPEIYFKCVRCGYFMSGDTKEIEYCICGTMFKDVDVARFGSRLGDSQIEVYRIVPKE